MTLPSGTRLGPYDIQTPIGAGGMGEVYKARDTRLDRTVAIKVLPQAVASDPEFRERFEREARIISALEHPHICPVYDVGREQDADFLVMQFLDGETLAERLARGPIPAAEALAFALEVASALDRAHAKGVVHRDLKPGNVMLVRSGRETHVKLLDFGLAKTVAGALTGGTTAAPATMTSPLTAQGAIVGTFQYMAPEQIEGRDADARSDIWAFGCVLYEMLTGRRAFQGASQASLIGAIMKDDAPRLEATPSVAPAALDHVIRRCLAKDPDERWQHIRDAAANLAWIQQGGGDVRGAAPVRRAWVPWTAAAIAFTSLVTTIAISMRPQPDGTTPAILSVLPPDDAIDMIAPAVSPDGTRVVYAAVHPDGTWRLWLRSIDGGTSRALPQTEDGSYPFWSPDGLSIGFFANAKLKVMKIAEGTARELASAPHGRGGDWNADGIILFAPDARSALYKIHADGGTAEPATRIDHAAGERTHRLPTFLPDGRRFLYLGARGVFATYAGSLDSLEQMPIADSPPTRMYYAPSGHVVFRGQGGTLIAQKFDLDTLRLQGDRVAVSAVGAIGEHQDVRGAPLSISRDGVLAFRPQRAETSVLTWFDERGRATTSLGAPGVFQGMDVSPDGRRVAMSRFDARVGRSGLWLLDADRGTGPRFTPEREYDEGPTWSPDGAWIAFVRKQRLLMRKSVATGREEQLFDSGDVPVYPVSWSADSQHLVVAINNRATRGDLYLLPAAPGAKPSPLVATDAFEHSGALSPDGRWFAYASDHTGRHEIWVQRFPSDGAVWQVSTEGGRRPAWSADGRRLFYVAFRQRLMAVPVKIGTDFEAGTPSPFLTGDAAVVSFAVTRDGRRALAEVRENRSAGSLTIVLNWPALLKPN